MRNQVSAHTLASLLGVSEKAIIQLAKRGVIAPAPKGRYYLQASVHSYCAFLRETGYDSCRYRGYDIVPRLERSKWCVAVHPTRPDLPILSHSTLRSSSEGRQEAIAAARQAIDRILLPLKEWLD
jgi:hypothetical protein